MKESNDEKLLYNPAFTLIELLVVIAIIGILSGLIVISLGGITDKANIAKAQVFSNSLRSSLMQSLVLEWKFDGNGVADGSPATAEYVQDAWSKTPGTIVGSPLVKTGSNCIKGSCLSFDGLSDYINVGTVTLDLRNGYTIEAWANYRTISGYGRGIITRRDSDDLGWVIFSYRNSTSTNDYILNYVEYTNSSNLTASTTPGAYLQTNQWYHLTLTVAADGISKYYVNGILKDSRVPTNFVKLGGKDATNTSSLYISGPSWKMDGMIDDMRFYNTVATIAEIKGSYYAKLNALLADGKISEVDYLSRMRDI